MYSSLLKITRLFGHLWGAILLHAISKHRHLVIYPALKALFSLADQTLGTSVAVAVLIWRMFFVQHMRSTNLFSLLLVRKNISLGELPLCLQLSTTSFIVSILTLHRIVCDIALGSNVAIHVGGQSNLVSFL